ncbi:MAG TPA: endonuclease/exonuclease/phosphatase family protein [Candidatus Binataceae bacterium]|nr:endonuclease/exonuclease/phosphatase family protein [Candidatus Binataceae bacterium]
MPAEDWMAIHDAALQASTGVSSGPPFEPMALNRPVVATRSPLKVAVLNARGGADFHAILACLSRPPLADAGTLLLCEASWRMPRHRWVEFAPGLAQALKMSFAFLPSFGRAGDGGEFRAIGNAILCAQPLDGFRAVPLSRPPNRYQPRRLSGVHQGLLASISVNGRRVTVGVVHLERLWDPEGRGRQMEDFLSSIGHDAPVIVGGDLNTTTVDMDRRWQLLRACLAIAVRPRRFRRPEPYEPLFDRIKAHGFSIEGANVPAVPTFTMSGLIPPRWRPKLDWIAARGIQPVTGSATVVPARTSIIGRRVSDHDFVLCEFRL